MGCNFSRFSNDEIENVHKIISKNIRSLRESKNIKQLDMALSIDIKSVAFYSNCENNKYGKHFNTEHIYKISKVLNVSIFELFRGVDNI